jgi:hypothetical protein
MKTKDQPINPCIIQQVGEDAFRLRKESDPNGYQFPQMGLTKREHASILILAGLLPDFSIANANTWNPTSYVKEAVLLADLLFEELDSKTES